jgi:hypothetical protein
VYSCCGAGTAADTEMTTRKIESQLELLKLNLGREVPVVVANRLIKQLLFRHQVRILMQLITKDWIENFVCLINRDTFLQPWFLEELIIMGHIFIVFIHMDLLIDSRMLQWDRDHWLQCLCLKVDGK